MQISLPIICFYLVKLKKWHLSFPVLFFIDSKSTQCWIKMKDFGGYHKRSGNQPILLPETEVAEVPLRFHMLTLQRQILHPATAKISSSQDQAWPSRISPLPNESFLVTTAWKLSSCSATPCKIKIVSLRAGLHVVSLQQNFYT